jgi:hypothetical protein
MGLKDYYLFFIGIYGIKGLLDGCRLTSTLLEADRDYGIHGLKD